MKLISAFRKFAKGNEAHLFWPKSFTLSFLCISENAAFMPLYSFKEIISITETELHCAVQTESLRVRNLGELHIQNG